MVKVKLTESQENSLFDYNNQLDFEFRESPFYSGPYNFPGSDHECMDFVKFIKSVYRVEISEAEDYQTDVIYLSGDEDSVTYLLLKL